MIRLVGGWVARWDMDAAEKGSDVHQGGRQVPNFLVPSPVRPHSRWQFGLWTLEAVALRVKMEKPGHLVSFTLYFLWVYRSLASKSLEIFSREGFIDIRRGTSCHYMGDENYILTFATSELLLLQGGKRHLHILSLTLKDFTKDPKKEKLWLFISLKNNLVSRTL